MSEEKSAIQNDVGKIVDEWIASNHLKKDDLFVIGCSTSEVAGEFIGTSGSEEIAANIYSELARLRDTTGVDRKSTRLNSSHVAISYADFCLKKKQIITK